MKFTFVKDKQKPHLGGNIAEGDPATFCPSSWEYIIKKYNISSVTDVGAGRGWAAKWFSSQGLDVTAIEGLEDNVKNSIYPLIEHDITTSPFIKNVDFVNCIEVVEHIEEVYIKNLLDTLCSGKYLLITHATPGQGGHHHVNEQSAEYWISYIEDRGYKFSQEDTITIRSLAKANGGMWIEKNGLFFIKE